jgi:threonine aldolase
MSQKIADFRSDTVTRPTPEMRRAMAEAVVGDDVLGDDPTVRQLEQDAAELFGHQAALFVPSGVMGNTIALKVLLRPMQAVILEERCHIMNFEEGNVAHLVGALPLTLPSENGCPDPVQIDWTIRHNAQDHRIPVGMVCLENTHNLCGGTVIRLEEMSAVQEVCRRHRQHLHLDGARVFNAVTALGCKPADIGARCDSLMVCLSKGLCAPVGSLLIGPAPFIRQARAIRKSLGGGMRQVGVLAAPGLIALHEMPQLLERDHRLARRLAEGLTGLANLQVRVNSVETNMVMVRLKGATAYPFAKALENQGILCLPFDASTLRLVTHHDVDEGDVDRCLSAFATLTRPDLYTKLTEST